MDREALLEPIIRSIREGTNMSRYDVLRILEDWEVIPGYLGGVHVCTTVIKGTEVHFAIVPEHRKQVILKGRTQEYLEPLFDRLGFLTTRVPHGATSKQKFVQRIGFKPTWTDANFQYYLLGQLPFARS